MTVRLHKESNKINTRRGTQQGDTILPKLFTAVLESIFRRPTWEPRGLKIDGEYLSHVPFAEDILIWANAPHDLQQSLQGLVDESDNQGMKMNKSKTKVMMENDTPIYVNNTQIENIKSWDSDTAPETKTKTLVAVFNHSYVLVEGLLSADIFTFSLG